MSTPPEAALAALAGLPGIGPGRLRRLLAHHEPLDALERLRSGRGLHPMVARAIPDLTRLREQARAASVDRAAEACSEAGVRVVPLGASDYPAQLAADPQAPVVLFVRGDLTALDARRVGVIGTRNATASGLATAADLGRGLADEGITVVSGLARGIDGAAHRGVQRSQGPGRPVGVVGNGLDRPYPKQHTELWRWVGDAGLLLSEWPPGVPPDAWRFPQRNRIIAALCEALVVVESRERGGSLITARAAAERSVEVMAVPGSPRSRASAGTNQLLVDGVAPVTSVLDVLAMLDLDHRRQCASPFDPRPIPDRFQSRLLDACAAGACTLDHIVAQLGASFADVALAAARLERDGWLVEAGGWFELAGSRLEQR
jgi:DNA processing protein